jgi:acyl-CoA dehydrogenase
MAGDGISMLAATVERLFSERVDKDLIVAAENGEWLGDLWAVVEENGLTRPHALADDGNAWAEAFVIARASGRHCVPLPLGETILASWLLVQAGIEVPAGPLTVIGPDTAVAERVPWARHAGHAVVVVPGGDGAEIRLVGLGGASIDPGHNLALEPRDRVVLATTTPIASAATGLPGNVLELYGALVRCGQMAGALDTLLDMSVRYAAERVQFGKPLASFQAIQQELARLAGSVAEAGVAADAAFAAAQRAGAGVGGCDPTFEIAAAKVVAGDAAEVAPRIAHQVHGAIGFTYEHALHFASRRLWSWRAEFGSASLWAGRLGRMAYTAGADGLWPMVTGRTVTVGS